MNSKRAILFDLGNTLVRYYEIPEFAPILAKCIAGARQRLTAHGWQCRINPADLQARVDVENYEEKDRQVRPLDGRLGRIFSLDQEEHAELLAHACAGYMEPIFALGMVYHDTIPTLQTLRLQGLKTAIVSNTPWGSSGEMWRTEIARLGLVVDHVVCCADVGWRKPAAPVFRRAMDLLGVTPDECVFVGDDPRWDVVGPQGVGMDAILIDRKGTRAPDGTPTIRSLDELAQRF